MDLFQKEPTPWKIFGAIDNLELGEGQRFQIRHHDESMNVLTDLDTPTPVGKIRYVNIQLSIKEVDAP